MKAKSRAVKRPSKDSRASAWRRVARSSPAGSGLTRGLEQSPLDSAWTELMTALACYLDLCDEVAVRAEES